MSQKYDAAGLYEFLLHTPESGLRKMLVDNKPMTEAHFNLMMKIVRNCDVSKFSDCFDKNEFPKIKMNPNDIKLKEKFWAECTTTFANRGLLNPADPQKVTQKIAA